MDQIQEIAKMIDHSILHPTHTDADLKKQCEIARKYKVASVCVKPYAVLQAVELLKGSEVEVGCVIGFPHGNSAIRVKEFETEQACREGATEIDMVVNIGKVLGGEWKYVEEEIARITHICHDNQAIVKVIFETDFVTKEEDIRRLCEICTQLKVDFVKTSTGYGFVKKANNDFNYQGATVQNVSLLKQYVGPGVRVKAAGGIRSLEDLLKMKEAGAVRMGATATEAIMEEAAKRFGK